MSYEYPVAEIKAAVNIEDVIGRYTEIVPSGKNYKGLCPFHDDHNTMSLSVVTRGTYKGKPTEGFFKCFSEACDKKGDVIDFVQMIENIEFTEACEILAKEGGVEIKKREYSPAERNHLKEVRSRTIRYMQELQGDQMAMQYVYDRGLTDQDILRWNIGLVPKDEKKYRPDEAHLFGRLSFPIFDGTTTPFAIAMGYRSLSSNPKTDKYIYDNTSFSPVFNSPNDHLYGLPFARKSIRDKGYAILVEGYFDVISMHKARYTNTVGSFGCGVSDEQLEILQKLTNKVLLWYDDDNAGVAAMRKTVPKFLERGMEVNVILGSQGKDPDDFVKRMKYNHKKLNLFLVEHSTPAVKFLIDDALESYEKQVLKLRLEALKKTMGSISMIKDPTEKAMYKKHIQKRLDV